MATMNDIRAKATEYCAIVRNKAHMQYEMSEKAERNHRILGIFVTLLTTVVGTTIFAALKQNQDWRIQLAAGFISIAAAVLSAFQTFFKFPEISAKRKTAASAYNSIKYSLDVFLVRYDAACTDMTGAMNRLDEITEQLKQVEKDAPSIPDSVYNKYKTP